MTVWNLTRITDFWGRPVDIETSQRWAAFTDEELDFMFKALWPDALSDEILAEQQRRRDA